MHTTLRRSQGHEALLCKRWKQRNANTRKSVIPLLFEAKMTDLVTEIWVIYAPFQQQIERLMKRDCLTQEQAYTRINNQMSLSEKCQKGDIVVDNSSTLEALLKQVDLAIAYQ